MDLLASARIYTRVVELGSISAAAREFEMGQPAVSERIDKLEKYLGAKLLLRSARTLVCTEEGRTFYDHSKRLLVTADATITSILNQEPGNIRGRVRIASAQCFGEIVLPRALLHARQKHPQLQLDLVLNDAVVDPVTEGVDISIRLGSLGEGGFVAHPLGQVNRVLVAAPSFIEAHGPIDTPAHLAHHPFIRVKGIFSNNRLALKHPTEGLQQITINTACTTSHWRPMYELIQAGSGIGVVQQPACVQALKQGRLIQLLPQYVVPPFDAHALVHAHRPTAPRIRAVLEVLKKEVPLLLKGKH
ncbi:LysR family transcriptional regulator [Pigmentiphaga sp. H8]|uniref:LysR family transcriptional regulator n=1 Tax=unclassified Pigmentiphaga TaxID=2626614 RepID=UPI000F59414E|nr:LysR family transcriptional regulator [Pigmentiphaga sp. H8]AZG08339.1 LysR family transcriptional regulator [Pigmentiphaga sp. H8]